MRIALVYDALYPWVAGGAERRFTELGRRLAERHEVHLVGWRWWDGPARIERDGMTLHGVGPAPALYGADGKRTVREAVGFAARLFPFLVRHRFDVIDCSATPYLPVYAAATAARVRGARLVVTWHEFWGSHWRSYLPERPMVAGVARRLESGARRIGDRVVPVSEFTARAMGIATDRRVEIVPNGVDLAAIDAATPADEVTDLLFLGRLIDEKRVDLLLETVGLLRGRFPRLRCTIVGDGPELPALRALAERLGVADLVAFRGRVPGDEVPRQLRSARVLVMPSVREGYGMAVAEAQAAAVVPVVVRSPSSAAPDLVRDGVDGIVVDPEAGQLAEAVASLLADPARLARLSTAARATGETRSWDEIALRMEAVYQGITAEEHDAHPVRRLRWS